MNRGSFTLTVEQLIKEYTEDNNRELLAEGILAAYVEYLNTNIGHIQLRIEDEGHRGMYNSSLIAEESLKLKLLERLENANIGAVT
jgi:hypothetical protein